MAAWVVLAASGSGAYVEAWRGSADTWFAALESTPITARAGDMFVARLDDIHFVRLVDANEGLPDADLVKVMGDGTLKRVRAADVDPPATA